MLFLFRSAVCIGAVALAAAGSGDKTAVRGMVNHESGEALQRLGRACVVSSGCLHLGASLAIPAPSSFDTLTPQDLATAWTGHKVGRGPGRTALDRGTSGET